MNNINVSFVLTHSIEKYGETTESYINSERYEHYYCKELAKRGVNLKLYYLSSKVKKPIKQIHKFGHTMIAVPCKNFYLPLKDLSLRLFKLLKEDKADIFHLHVYYTLIFDYLAFFLNKHKRKFISQYHGGTFNIKDPYAIPKQILMRFSLPLSNKVLILNREEIDRVSKFVRREKLELFTNGIDEKFFVPKKIKKTDEKIVLYAGRLSKEKGIRELVAASKRFKDVKFWVAGSGKYEKLVRRGNITFFGMVPHKKLVNLYNKCSFLIMPSYIDAFPFAAIEGMVCGKPILGTDVGGFKDIITEDVGIKIKPNDVDALVDGIKHMFTLDLEKMGKNARKKVLDNYTWDKTINKLIRIYKEVLE